MASAVNPITASSGSNNTTPPTAAASAGADAAGNQQVFLQLLVSQLQNQDPMYPTDSTQFVSELAQFSELEQVIAIRGDIETYHTQAAAQTAATGQTNAGQNTNTGQTGSSQPPTVGQTLP
jgi:flagellar basal-body rod modification protein FlgD